jgi:hypothetical protein
MMDHSAPRVIPNPAFVQITYESRGFFTSATETCCTHSDFGLRILCDPQRSLSRQLAMHFLNPVYVRVTGGAVDEPVENTVLRTRPYNVSRSYPRFSNTCFQKLNMQLANIGRMLRVVP